MTTNKSRADALKDAVWRLKRDLECGNVGAGTSLVYMADLRILIEAVEQHEAEPTIHANFETIDGQLVGTSAAPVMRVDKNDDGSFTVIIDYWPQDKTPLEGTGNGADERAPNLSHWKGAA